MNGSYVTVPCVLVDAPTQPWGVSAPLRRPLLSGVGQERILNNSVME